MEAKPVPYQKQIFVCTNDNKGEKPSCCDHQGAEIFTELRRLAKDKGIHPRIRVAQAKCLGQCAMGANVMVYPDNIWYSHVRMSDIPTIVAKHF